MTTSGESIGAARLDLTVNTDSFDASITRTKGIIDGMGESAKRAFDMLAGDSKKAANSLIKYGDQVRMAGDEWRFHNAEMKNVPKSIIDEVRAKVARYRDEVAATAQAEKDRADGFAQAQAKARAAAAELKRAAEEEAQLRARVAAQADRQVAAEVNAALRQKKAADDWVAAEARRVNAIGKTRSELMELEAIEKNRVAQMAPLIAKQRAYEQAMAAAATRTRGMALSARELEIAMRGVPAQLTDIGVSLAGGQNPFMVLLQQGGQLRDMFGGIRPAIGAFGNALLGLINPATATAAVLATMGLAVYQNVSESERLDVALAKAGRTAGVTADQLESMASRLDNVSRTQSQLTDAMAEIAASGKFTADQMGFVAAAAVDMRNATGRAIEETVAEFADLAKDPIAAITKLNQAQHFLTDETYAYIRSLQEQGREQEAATVAMRTWAVETQQRAEDVRNSLTGLSSWWREVRDSAREAWDVMRQALDGATDKERLNVLNKQIDALTIGTPSTGILAPIENWLRAVNPQAGASELARLERERKALMDKLARDEAKAERDRTQQKIEDSTIALAEEAKAFTSNMDKLTQQKSAALKRADDAIAIAERANATEELKRLREHRATIEKGFDAKIAAEAKRGKGGGDRSARALANAEAREELAEIKAHEAAKRNEIQNSTQILQAEYNARLVTSDQYFSQMRELAQRDSATQEQSIQAQIAALRARDVAGVDAANVQRQLAELESRLAQVRADSAVRTQLLTIQENTLKKQREDAVRQYATAMSAETAAMQQQFDLQVMQATMSEREYRQKIALAQVARDYAEELKRLDERKLQGGDFTEEMYRREVEIARQAMEERVQIVNSGFDRMDAAQQDWLNGMQVGFENWADQVQDVAAQTERMTTNAFQSISDAIADTANGNKEAWKGMLISMLKELQAFLIKQAVLKAAYAFSDAVWGTSSASGGIGWAKGGVADTNGITAFAKGGTFTNNVYSSPTMFKFAKGSKFGVMGEAGPEAVMPLQRDSKGRLGVIATGAGGSGPVSINVTTIVNADGTSDTNTDASSAEQSVKQFSDNIKNVVNEQLVRALAPNGLLWKAGVRAS